MKAPLPSESLNKEWKRSARRWLLTCWAGTSQKSWLEWQKMMVVTWVQFLTITEEVINVCVAHMRVLEGFQCDISWMWINFSDSYSWWSVFLLNKLGQFIFREMHHGCEHVVATFVVTVNPGLGNKQFFNFSCDSEVWIYHSHDCKLQKTSGHMFEQSFYCLSHFVCCEFMESANCKQVTCTNEPINCFSALILCAQKQLPDTACESNQ